MKLSSDEKALLQALVTGRHLKTHRTLDGDKISKLHDIDGSTVRVVPTATVQRLVKLGLLAPNMKFPAAAYLLTERGAAIAATLSGQTAAALTVRFPPPA